MPFFWQRPRAPDIRRLEASDAWSCAALHAASFSHPWSPEELEALIAERSTTGHAAVAKGRLVGFVLSRGAAEEAEILTLAVDSWWRRNGVARALLETHLQDLAWSGTRQLFLEVAADNTAALALYNRFEFRRAGERQGYYPRPDGTRMSAYILRRDL